MKSMMFPLQASILLSPQASALYMFILAWSNDAGVCPMVDEMAELEGPFRGISFENAMEELVQEGLIEERYVDEQIENEVLGVYVRERRDARIVWFEQLSQSRLAPYKWEKLRAQVFERDGYVCRYCGARGTSLDLECDHVEPLSLGGTNELGNLVTACQRCNRSKRDRLLEEWRSRGELA